MKTKGIIFLFILISATISSQDLFYYYKGDKIYLEVDKNFINVINIEKSQVFSPSILSEFNFELSNSDSKNLKLAFKSTPSDLEYIRTVNALEKANVKVFPYFKRKGKSSPISISHVFYVKIKESSDLFLLNNLLEENNV